MHSDRDYGGRRAPLTRPNGPGLPDPADAIHAASPSGPADSAERHAVRRDGGVTVTATTCTVNDKTLSPRFAMSRPAAAIEAMAPDPGPAAADETGGEDNDGPSG